MRFKGSRKSLPEIAQELKVDAVVAGSVQRASGRVKFTAQLIQAATDAHLWANEYERDLSDVLKLQSKVARSRGRDSDSSYCRGAGAARGGAEHQPASPRSSPARALSPQQEQ
jgi:hypothetical protein